MIYNKLQVTGRFVLFNILMQSFFFSPGQNDPISKGNTREELLSRNPERIISITALQAGSKHYSGGNPGHEANFSLFAEQAMKAARSEPKPDLICFPEYAIAGWPYPTETSMNSLAEEIPGTGHWFGKYISLARETGIPVLGWLLEKKEGKLYNTSFLLDGKGNLIGKYSKVHANLGEQTWWGWSQGEQFRLIEMDGVKYGVSICADMWYPETTRCEELLGADVILHVSIADDMGHLIPARAFDSHLPIVASIFQGGSYAVDDEGKLLGKLQPELPGFITFQVKPFREHFGKKYGGIWDIKKGGLNVRNTGAYSILTDPATRPAWTEIFKDNKGNPQTKEQLLERFKGRYDANEGQQAKTILGLKGTRFTINGRPVFLYGISYYGGLGASEEFILRDLSDMQKFGFNWIRVWANWNGFGKDVSCIDGEGNPRQPWVLKLKWLVNECDNRGIIVDVTFTRGKDNSGPRLFTVETHSKAVESVIGLLKDHRNWYLDLANERDVRDPRFVDFGELKILRELAGNLFPELLVTASAGNDISSEDLRQYLLTVGVDFICPHRPRTTNSILQTREKTIGYFTSMKEIGKTVPVHYQEPFRRGYTDWQPAVLDYVNDLIYAKAGGAAGWCFHNGGQKDDAGGFPRRSFDMSEKRLFDQLDPIEIEAIETILKLFR